MSDLPDPDDIETVHEGFFRFRATKGAPWQALRIIRESGAWVAILSGEIVPGSSAAMAKVVQFRRRGAVPMPTGPGDAA